MKVLGLSYGFHDSAAALIIDQEIVAATQQERLSRLKNDAGFPAEAARFCLERAGIKAQDVDLIAYYEEPLVKFDRIVSRWPATKDQTTRETVARWLRQGKFDPAKEIAHNLGVDRGRVRYNLHHRSHAASAFYCSPFDQATIVTLDGVGEYETATIGIGRNDRIETLASVMLPHSIGLFYSAFTAFLGFPINEGEYKVMGMAAFGQPKYRDDILGMLSLHDDGSFLLAQDCFNFSGDGDLPFSNAMIDRFGLARNPGAPFGVSAESLPSDVSPELREAVVSDSRRFADIAASVQAATEAVIAHVVRQAVSRTGIRNVAMSGGVALNSMANGRLIREGGYNLFVQPAAGDAGSALGAAQYHWHHTLGGARTRPMTSAALGRAFTFDEIDSAIRSSGFSIEFAATDWREYCSYVAGLIARGAVVGWHHGRSEWGPRALGNRSILADPRQPGMQRLVNEKIKFREPFRPFAPAVPAEYAAKYFDMGEGRVLSRGCPEAFMLAVHPVRPEFRSKLPAVTHVDGSARVQIVHAEDQPDYHALLQAFGVATGMPVLLNTSFNLNGEPIVDSPTDAARTFSLSGLDYLCMSGVVVSKSLATSL